MAADAVASRASLGEISAMRASRIAATWAAASCWRPVRTAASTRSIVARKACGAAMPGFPAG